MTGLTPCRLLLLGLGSAADTGTGSTEFNKGSRANLNFCCWLNVEPHKSPSEQHLQNATEFWSLVWSPVCLDLRVKNPISSQKMKISQGRAAFPELLLSLAHSQSCTAQPVPQPQIFFLKDFPLLTSVAPGTS